MKLFSKKTTQASSDDKILKATMTVMGMGFVLGASVLGTAGLGAYMAYTTVAATSGTALAVAAGAGGLFVGGALGFPVGGVLIAAGALAIGTLKLGGAIVGGIGRALTKPFVKSATKKVAKAAAVPAENQPASSAPKGAKGEFDTAKKKSPQKGKKPAAKRSATPKA